MSKILPWSFETEFGSIQPNEPVVFLSTHAGNPTFGRAVYLGVSSANTKCAVIEYDKKTHGFKHVDHPEPMTYSRMQAFFKERGTTWTSASKEVSYVPFTVRATKTLKLNRMIPARN